MSEPIILDGVCREVPRGVYEFERLSNKDKYRRLVEAMTNRDRKLWARKGYPFLRERDGMRLGAMYPHLVRRLTGEILALNELPAIVPPAPLPAERIEAAAIRRGKDVFHLPPPARHHTLLHSVPRRPFMGVTEEGFYTNLGRFVGRREALTIAKAAGQLRRRAGEQYYQGPELFSEDVW